jgi:hypothetical protein
MDKGAVVEIIFGRWRSQIAYAGARGCDEVSR